MWEVPDTYGKQTNKQLLSWGGNQNTKAWFKIFRRQVCINWVSMINQLFTENPDNHAEEDEAAFEKLPLKIFEYLLSNI